MCRWLAYSGPPIFLDTVLFKPEIPLSGNRYRPASLYFVSDLPLSEFTNSTDEPHEKAILILSEPLDHIRDNWTEAPENSIVVAAEDRAYVLPLPASD